MLVRKHLLVRHPGPRPEQVAQQIFGASLVRLWTPDIGITGSPTVTAWGESLGRDSCGILSSPGPTHAASDAGFKKWPTVTVAAGAGYPRAASSTVFVNGVFPWLGCVAKLNAGAAVGQHLLNIRSTSGARYRIMQLASATSLTFVAHNLTGPAAITVDASPHVYLMGNDGAGSVLRMDATETTRGTDTAALDGAVENIAIGGNASGASSQCAATYACAFFLTGRPSAAQWTAWRAYCAARWGTP